MLAAPASAVPQTLTTPAAEQIRAAADGAGPSHIFWLSGDRRGDVVGVVDPLFAAIRFYRVRQAATPDEDLATRLDALGVCALPVDFRPWRVHHLKRRVLIESMPDPGAIGHAATLRDLRTRMVSLDRGLLGRSLGFDAAARRIDARGWDPAREAPCGPVGALRPIGMGTPERATRASARAILLGSGKGALAKGRTLAVRSVAYRLISARELEPGGGLRIVQASEALPSGDGVIRVRSRILAYSRGSGRLRRALALDDSALRGKFGQKPLAVLPSGEMLVMGKDPGAASPFRIRSCGNIAGTLSGGICTDEAETPGIAITAVPTRRIRPAAASTPLRARTIFDNVERLVSYRLSVDTSGMPEDCRRAEGCSVEGERARFVPIRGIRLTRGIFTRRGVPYAQGRVPEDVDRLLAATPGQLGHALAEVEHGARGWPGNLADGLEGDLGIDCSGLVQIAWGGRGASRLDTQSLQALASPLACSSRLPGPEWLRPGDAIGLRIDSPVHLANHVVLFAAAMRLDGASDAWLTLESSSGCDGICWSVYDPAMFDGWGLYRANGRSDAACVDGASAAATPIPYDLARWTRLTAGR